MNKTETRRFFAGLRSAGWSDERINRFLRYLKTGEEPFKPEVVAAMEEARRLSRDPNTKKYDSYEEALKDLEL